MPIVDGLTSTKMIRAFEKSNPGVGLSQRAMPNGRVPIFAVSASLVERDREKYTEAGFDGWILKPIDFNRLKQLLAGIVEDGTRSQAVYTPGRWEAGGWFTERRVVAWDDDTAVVTELPSPDPQEERSLNSAPAQSS